MKLDAFTLDQLQLFAAIADEGSFSAAARRLGRAQSAVTYGIQTLERQMRAELFDRSAYRPVLSEAGRALMPRVRRILEEAADLQIQAQGMAGGLEAELALVVDSMFPMDRVVRALTAFQEQYPSVQTRLNVETLGATTQAVIEAQVDIGIVIDFTSRLAGLVRTPIGVIDLVPVASPAHPLAEASAEPDDLRSHVQLVLSDRSSLTKDEDRGVFAIRTWRIADLGAKHAMLLAGLGWGSMPAHMVEADIAAGRLVRLPLRSWDGDAGMPRLAVALTRRSDRAIGPAGQWFWDHLSQTTAG